MMVYNALRLYNQEIVRAKEESVQKGEMRLLLKKQLKIFFSCTQISGFEMMNNSCGLMNSKYGVSACVETAMIGDLAFN